MKKNQLVLILSLLLVLNSTGFGTILHVPAQYSTIQDAIEASWHGDTVLVAPGTYYEHISPLGNNIVIGSQFLLSGNPDDITNTIIDGYNSGRVITIENGETGSCKIIGLTIQNGSTPGYGGGILIWESSPQVLNCVIQNNVAASHGGGLCITGYNSGARAINCTIQNNTADSYGGGLFMGDCGPDAEVIACIISGNTITCSCGLNGSGGGVNLYHSGRLTNCLIINNSAPNATAGGGGIQCDWGDYNGSQDIFITGCTIANNTGVNWGGVSSVMTGGEFRNCIIWGNTDSNGNVSNFLSNSFVNSCSNPLPDGVGNISADPSFLSPGAGNFRLSEGSPCINAGDNTYNTQELDLDGNTRIIGTIDMGAYEKAENLSINVQIGAGTEINATFPIYTCYGFNYSQQIYLGSEILAGGGNVGTILKIRFFYAGTVPYSAWNEWTVYLGNTTQSEFINESDWIPVSSLTQVFSGIIPEPVEGTWLELTLSTPFHYSGDNLVVAVDENSSNYACTAQWGSFYSGSPRGLLFYNDFENPDPASPPDANIPPQFLLAQIQLEFNSGFGILEGFVTEAPDCTMPIAGATITSGPYTATTNALGYYVLPLPGGVYLDVTAHNGTINQTISPVTISTGITTTQDFCLDPSLAPPLDLKASVSGANQNTAHLTWLEPGSVPDQWIHWDDGTNTGALGYSTYTVFSIASRWPVADIAPYNGTYLKKIRFFPTEASATYVLKVWKGTDAATLLHSQNNLSLNINQWNEITLSSPVFIDGTEEFWFGIEITQTAGFPAGLAPGPAIAGKGDMINSDSEWFSMKNLWNLDYNWALQGFVSENPALGKQHLMVQTTTEPVLKPLFTESAKPQVMLYEQPMPAISCNAPSFSMAAAPSGGYSSAVPTGYNVYRDNVKIADNISDLFYDDQALAKGTYNYEVSARYVSGESSRTGPLQVNIYTCFPPTDLSVSNSTLTTTTAELSWTPSTLSENPEWVLVWGSGGFDPEYATPIHITSSPSFLLSGLEPGYEYDFFVRTFCSADDQSIWVKKTFRTHYFECSANAITEAEPCGDSTNNGCDMAIPSFEAIQNGDTICGKVWLSYQKRDSDWYEFTLAEASDVSLLNNVEFTCFIGIKAPSCSSGGFITSNTVYPWWQATLATRLAAGTYYINLAPSFNGSVNCDSLARYQLSLNWNDCLTPTGLNAVNITETSADLIWNSTEGSWNVEWGPGQFTQSNGTLISGINQNPYTLSGLNSGYTYSYYVQSDCGNGSVSNWVGPYTFFVPCAAQTLPYTENFSVQDIGNTPQCWQLQGISNSSNWIASNSNSAGGTAPELSFVPNAPNYNGRVYMTSPIINTAGQTELNLSFRQRIHSWNSSALCEIWTTSDGGASWSAVWSYSPNGIYGPETTTLTISTPDVGSANFQFAFALSGFSWGINTWQIDDISLTPPSTGKIINLKVFLEGLYGNEGSMNQAMDETGPHYGAGIADKVSFELHNNASYSSVEYASGLVNLHPNGAIVHTIPDVFSGSYYITVKHRNSIQITTAAPVDFSGGIISYDFSTTAAQAFGANQKNLGEGVFGLFGGDANADGSVDALDLIFIQNASNSFSSGYVDSDINGDGMVDALDLIISDNNASKSVTAQHP